MDIAYLFFIAVLLIELVLSYRWNRRYFRTGIPVFWCRLPVRLAQVPTPAELELMTETRWFDPLSFHSLPGGELAFREMLFVKWLNRGGGVPIMRGLIRQDSAGPFVDVIGFLNWYVLAFIAFSMVLIVEPETDPRFALLPLLAMLGFYLLQVARFSRVARSIGGEPIK